MNDQQIEAHIQAKGLMAPRVTPADLEASIASEHYFTGADGHTGANLQVFGGGTLDYGPKAPDALSYITICVLILKNGHKIVGVNTGPVSPENFDEGFARDLARDNALDQIWPLLGYELRSKLHHDKLARERGAITEGGAYITGKSGQGGAA